MKRGWGDKVLNWFLMLVVVIFVVLSLFFSGENSLIGGEVNYPILTIIIILLVNFYYLLKLNKII